MSPDVPDITPDLPPEDDAAMRALLGSLGSGDATGADDLTMPADVQARLDTVIAAQAAERGGAGAARTVRRLAVAWVGAAAAVLVAVAGIGVVANQFQSAGNDSASEAMSSRDADSAGPESAPGAASSESDDAPNDTAGKALQDAGLPVIRPGHVAEDAAGIATEAYAARALPQVSDGSCVAQRPARAGTLVIPVSYRDEPAVLIVTPGPPRVATVWSCADEELESAELPD